MYIKNRIIYNRKLYMKIIFRLNEKKFELYIYVCNRLRDLRILF